MVLRCDQAGQRGQTAPRPEVQPGRVGRCAWLLQALHGLRHLVQAQRRARLRRLPAHHGQVADGAACALVQRHHHGIVRAFDAWRGLRQQHAVDRAAAHIDQRHEARRDQQLLEGPAAQPGLQPQVQPQAGRPCGHLRAPGQRGTTGLPALAHRVVQVQVVRWRRDLVAGMFPPDAASLGLEAGAHARVEPRPIRRCLAGAGAGAVGSSGQGPGCGGAGVQSEGELRHGKVLGRRRDVPGSASVDAQWLTT